MRGEDRIAILDAALALAEAGGAPGRSLLRSLPTVNGPAQVWFDRAGTLAFVVSQKVPRVDVFRRQPRRRRGIRSPERGRHDRRFGARTSPGFTPFQKTSPDGAEIWLSHKLADAVSVRSTAAPFGLLDAIAARRKGRGRTTWSSSRTRGAGWSTSASRGSTTAARAGSPRAGSRSSTASAAPGARKVVGTFFSHGREAHGLWTNPANTLLYVAHEQDELPGTPNAGQTVASAFDVSDPFAPRFIAQIPLGSLTLPSGELRNKKSINLVYVRPGYRGQTA